MTSLTRWWCVWRGVARRDGRARRACRRTSSVRSKGPALALESLENRDLLSFAAPVNFSVGRAPFAVLAGDFNEDGRPDLVTVNEVSNSVSLLAGKGHGGFRPARDFAVGRLPVSLAAADLNGDGTLDLVTANSGDGTVSVLLGNGDGSFQGARSFPAGEINVLATSVAVGDVNGDGILDIVVGNRASGDSVSVLLGNGDGTFRAPVETSLGQDVLSVAVGDFNGDHRLDVLAVVADPSGLSSTVTVLLGNGDGTFRTGARYDVGYVGFNGRSLAVGDVNGDNKLDFAVATGSDVRVFLGNGDGTFRNSQIDDTRLLNAAVTVADVNGDNQPDLVVTGIGRMVDVFLGNGDGTFQAARAFPTAGSQSSGAAVVDLNGDGLADLAVVNADSDSVSVLRGDGQGDFRIAPTYPLPAAAFSGAVADLNRDGLPDLVVGASNGINVFLGNGDGTFRTPVIYPVGDSFFVATSVVVADVNGDGIPDIVATGPGYRSSGNAVYVLLGNGDGTFRPPQSFTVAYGPEFVAVADLNGDGLPDLVVTSPATFPGMHLGRTVSVLLGNGDGTFQPAVPYTVGTDPTAVIVADVNGGGTPDLVVTYGGATSLHVPGGVDVLLGNGDGSFQDAATLVSGFSATALVATDFNGDNILDLAVTDGTDGLVKVYQGNGDGTFRDAQNYAVGPSPSSLVAGDFNGDGLTDLAVGGPFGVRLLTGKPDGTFQAPPTSFGPYAAFLAVGDLNGDGLLDVVTDQAILLNKVKHSPRIDAPSGSGPRVRADSPPGLDPASVNDFFTAAYRRNRRTSGFPAWSEPYTGAQDLWGMDGTDLDTTPAADVARGLANE